MKQGKGLIIGGIVSAVLGALTVAWAFITKGNVSEATETLTNASATTENIIFGAMLLAIGAGLIAGGYIKKKKNSEE